MNRFFRRIIIVSAACVLLTGCGKKEETVDNTVKDDLVEFVSVELPSIQEERDNAINKYNECFNNDSISPDDFLAALENEAVPELTSYIDKLNAIEVTSDEVKELKDAFYNSSSKQLEAMNYVVVALKEKDAESLNKAEACLNESASYLTNYETQLKTLAAEYNIEIVGDFSTIQNISDVENTESSETSETTTGEATTVEDSSVEE